jgi:alkaline phosphatase D
MKLSRRGFLRTVVVSAGAASLGPSVLGCGDSARPTAEVFPQSVASGDPRDTSIVLWTRALPLDEADDAAVTLEVATDEGFGSRVSLSNAQLTARADHDHCVRVKVTGLTAGTTFYYRFVHAGTVSHTGRFRTAPAAGTDAPVRFAFASCQDRVGRYYNSLLRLLDDDHDDLAFVVHLGDYVYETTGDPGFMMVGSERTLTFRAPEEAIQFGTGDEAFYSARSLGNYRDLYRTYRSDPILQRVHDKFPFICTWDDHEFSDDCWQDTATSTDGVLEETDRLRRVASEQAWLEYMPVATDLDGEGELRVNVDNLFPNNRIFRQIRFGRNLSLAITDFRSFRPDHPTPEEAFPGVVILDQEQLQDTLARLQMDGDIEDAVTAFATGGFRTYVDLDEATYADHARALELLLTAAYGARGVPAERAAMLAARYAQGKTDAAILQSTIAAGRASLPAELQGVSAIDPTDASLPRGLAYAMLGKSTLTSQLGARYLTVQRTYELVQAYRTRVQAEAGHDDALGATQQEWLADALASSDATWNVVGNSVCSTSLVLDLRGFAGALPEALPAERYYLNVDQWDGFPERRAALLREVYAPANAVLLAGDIHAAYATDFGADASGNRVIELTTPGVSSAPFRELLFNTGNAVPAIRDSGLLVPVLDGLDGFLRTAYPALQYTNSNVNGITVVSLDATTLRADFHQLPPATVSESFYDRPDQLAGRWTVTRFVVEKQAGKNGPLTEVV